jgi:hypothetical protein
VQEKEETCAAPFCAKCRSGGGHATVGLQNMHPRSLVFTRAGASRRLATQACIGGLEGVGLVGWLTNGLIDTHVILSNTLWARWTNVVLGKKKGQQLVLAASPRFSWRRHSRRRRRGSVVTASSVGRLPASFDPLPRRR